MEGNTSRVIGTAALISVGVGTLNSFYKTKKPPSLRFFVGSGAAFVILSAIGEAEPEVGKALAVAVAVTMIFGEGNGALAYLNHHGETDTTPPKSEAGETSPLVSSADEYPRDEVITANAGSRENGPNVSSSVFTAYGRPFQDDIIGLFPGVSG